MEVRGKIQQYAADLRAIDASVRCNAMTALVSIAEKHPDAVAPHASDLAVALKDDSGYVRWGAVAILGFVARKHPDVVAPFASDLVAMLEDKDKDVRSLAAAALVCIDASKWGPKFLKDGDKHVRWGAAWAFVGIAKICPDAAMPFVSDLTAALKDSDEDVRECAGLALEWAAER